MSAVPNDYFFAHDGLFVIPIEALSPGGIDDVFATELLNRGAMGSDALALFNRAYAGYHQRCADLNQRAPSHWFPPRVQHVCLSTEPTRTRPYFQPFNKNSWLLYAADFDPATSSPEFATFQFLQAERMGLMGQVVPAIYFNLSYFLTLDEDQLRDFRAGCRRTSRPDAPGYRALIKELPQILKMHHETLRPPTAPVPGLRAIPDTGLMVTDAARKPLARLERAWTTAAGNVFKRHRAAHAARRSAPGHRLCDWLEKTQPLALLTGDGGRILWEPGQSGGDELRSVMQHLTADAEASIEQDLGVISRHSRRFLDSLRDPEGLVDPAPYITEGGLSYIHRDRKLIGYGIGSDNAHRLWEPTPPYERWMLAARTVHEWGHLAAESGWVGIPEDKAATWAEKADELRDLFEQVHTDSPPGVKHYTTTEVTDLKAKTGSIGAALLKTMQARIEDFQANLLARLYLGADEMDTYVRNNVCCHLNDYRAGQVYHQLCRMAYEFQYLRLSRIADPLDWFFKSTWFGAHFLGRRIITPAQTEQLFLLVSDLCDCYRVDMSRFDLEASAADCEEL